MTRCGPKQGQVPLECSYPRVKAFVSGKMERIPPCYGVLCWYFMFGMLRMVCYGMLGVITLTLKAQELWEIAKTGHQG